MKKILTFIIAAIAAMTVSANHRIVWEGDSAISWNQEVFKGGQFESDKTDTHMFDDLIKGDTILATVVAKIESPDYRMTYKAGTEWDWTDLATSANEGVISYVVESDEIASEIKRGLIIRGQGFNLISLTIAELGDDPDWAETTVWTTETPKAISWDNNTWPGSYFDTYDNDQATVPTLKAGNVIRAYITSSLEDAQYRVTYKDGNDWRVWTDLTSNVVRGVLSATIPSNEVAELLYNRGIVISGIKYYINKVTVYAPKGGTTAIENTSVQKPGVKVMRDGVMYIRRGETLYNMQGQIVK